MLIGGFTIALPPVLAVILGAPLYLLAALLPAVAVVVYALASARQSRRGVPARVLYGGCAATTIAMIAEMVLFVILAVVAYGALSATAGGREALEALTESITAASAVEASQAAAEEAVMDALMDFLQQPVVLLAAFAMLGFLGPLVEELAKVGVIAVRTPGRRARAWAWGVASGAGFGAVEALALSTMAFGAWPISMTMRAGATLMHATTAGVAALGVYALVRERRPGVAVAALAAAVLAHAGWNSLVLVAAVGGTEDSSGFVSGVAIALLGGLFAVIAMVFARLSRSVAEDSDVDPESVIGADPHAPAGAYGEPLDADERAPGASPYDPFGADPDALSGSPDDPFGAGPDVPSDAVFEPPGAGSDALTGSADEPSGADPDCPIPTGDEPRAT